MSETHDTPRHLIHQAVHGYSDGHRLLASSCSLPRDAERTLLLLSDLSGAGGGDQFDPYLTGYPLDPVGRYALARTWPAPEMGRPGCVWTHTLLIAHELLAQMNSPEEFLALFSRPSAAAGFGGFHVPLRVPELFAACERQEGIAESAALGAPIVAALYDSAAPFALLAVPRYQAATAPLLSAWRLQWPALRQRFTFCGGARAIRTLDGEQFILQAAAQHDVRRLDRGHAPPVVIQGDLPEPRQQGEWARIAALEFSSRSADGLVGFFNRVGEAVPADTRLFRPVVQAYAVLGQPRPPRVLARDLVSLAASEFPRPDAGAEFKSALLGPDGVSGLPETALMEALAEAERQEAFDPDGLRLRQRGAAAWSSAQDAWGMLSRLMSAEPSPLSEAVLGGLIDRLPAEFSDAAIESGPAVLRGLLRRSPVLATRASFWPSSPERQNEAARVLAEAGGVLADRAVEVIKAALQAGASPTDPDLLRVFGGGPVPAVMEWLDRDPPRIAGLPAGWVAALKRSSQEMLAWLIGNAGAHQSTARFVLEQLDTKESYPPDALAAALARHLPAFGPDPGEGIVRLASAALRSSLQSTAAEPVVLAAASLDTVYKAAKRSRMPDDAWNDLAGHLPGGSWWQSWDRCERIRMGVADKFRSGDWPAAALITVTKDDTLAAEIVGILKGTWSGRKLVAEAAELAPTGTRRDLFLAE